MAHLIPTADKSTWKFDSQVVFLGEWCLTSRNEELIRNMNYLISPPYGCSKFEKDRDYLTSKETFNDLLDTLVTILNDYHQVNLTQKSWKILVGPWLLEYVQMVTNRVNTLLQCLNIFAIDSISAESNSISCLASETTQSFMWNCQKDSWNHQLSLKLLDLLGLSHIKRIDLKNSIEKQSEIPSQISEPIAVSLSYRFQVIIFYLQHLFDKLVIRNKALVIGTYQSLFSEIRLQIGLGLFPFIYRGRVPTIRSRVDSFLRINFTKFLQIQRCTSASDVAKALLFEVLPICFLEGFEELKNGSDTRTFPRNPKLIFTVNNFMYDEEFKFYSAFKSNEGSKIINGQHGASGILRHENPPIEEMTCDQFLTWGWKGQGSFYLSTFMYRNFGKSIPKSKKDGKLLLIETSEPLRVKAWDTCYEYRQYLKAQNQFVNLLHFNPKSNLLIRLPLDSAIKGSPQKKDFLMGDQLEFDQGIVPIRKLLIGSRLVVHSYNSTGICETLAFNFPTIAFWNEGVDEVRDEVVPIFNSLRDAGILHSGPASASNQINQVWDNIDSWWLSKETQSARNLFCETLARFENASHSQIRMALKSFL